MLLLALAGGPDATPATYATTLRGARATVEIASPDAFASAPITYGVNGLTARASLAGAMADGDRLLSFHLIDAAGFDYPLLRVVGVQCARDCERSVAFYRFAASPPSLTLLQVSVLEDSPSGSAVGACFAIANPQTLYSWDLTSAIPIRPSYHERYVALRTDDGSMRIVLDSVLYALPSDPPPSASPPPETPLVGRRVQRDGKNLAPCRSPAKR